jgi:hypothetical protein
MKRSVIHAPAAARHATRRNSPLNDEPLTGREAVAEAIQTVYTLAANLTYKEAPRGETHHSAFFRLQIEDTVVNPRPLDPQSRSDRCLASLTVAR